MLLFSEQSYYLFGARLRRQKMVREEEWIYKQVMAPVLGAYRVNITFAKKSPYATPFIYIQFNADEGNFAVVDRAWQQVVLFNVDLFTKSFLLTYFGGYRFLEWKYCGLKSEDAVFDFGLQLCLTGIHTDLPLYTILINNILAQPIEEPMYNLRHTMQQFGYNFCSTPALYLAPLCGDYFEQPFNLTNHIVFYLELRRQFNTLSPIKLSKHMKCTDRFIAGLQLFKAFCADAYQLYSREPILFGVLCDKQLKPVRNGAQLLIQLDRQTLAAVARLVFLRHPK
jgi:hypothetical protein